MTVGRYRVLREVGVGAFATVYRAYDVQHKRYVALKVLKAEHHEESEMAQRFRREVAAALRLSGHPHIVSVYALGHVDRALYIAMEFIEGTSLTELMAGPADPDLAVRVVTAIASALDAAHSVGIIHRDVKPSNVMVARDGRIVLSDFGIAGLVASAEQVTMTGMLLGTPDYMAPELTTGAPASPASDQYALAVMAYELLVGQRPFSGVTPLALLYAHVHEQPQPPTTLRADLPLAVDAVVLRGLAKNPTERYESCFAFAAALSEALGIAMPEHGPTRVGSTLDALVAKARELADAGDHDGARRAVDAALRLMPGHPALHDLQRELEEERRLAERYERGVRHLQAREWLAAREIFNALFAERPNYRDVAELRKQAFAGIAQAWAQEERRAHAKKSAANAVRSARDAAVRPARGRGDEVRPAGDAQAAPAPRAPSDEPPEPKKTPEEEELEDLVWRYEAAKSAIDAGDWRTALLILEGLQTRAPTLLDDNRQLFLGIRPRQTVLQRRAPTAREVLSLIAKGRTVLEEQARAAEQAGRAIVPSYRPARFLRSAFSHLLSGIGKRRRSRDEDAFDAAEAAPPAAPAVPDSDVAEVAAPAAVASPQAPAAASDQPSLVTASDQPAPVTPSDQPATAMPSSDDDQPPSASCVDQPVAWPVEPPPDAAPSPPGPRPGPPAS
jgi:serine/threonine-protein kinase